MVSLKNIVRSTAITAAAIGALTFSDAKRAEAQQTCNPKVEVCTTTDRPSTGFWDNMKARFSGDKEVVDYIRQKSCKTVKSGATPAQDCQVTDIELELRDTAKTKRFQFTERTPGMHKTHIYFDPNDSKTCYGYHAIKGNEHASIYVPAGNPSTARWMHGDNCFTGKELGNRTYRGLEGPVIAAKDNRDPGKGELYIVEATPVNVGHATGPARAPASRTRKQRTVPAKTTEVTEQDTTPQYTTKVTTKTSKPATKSHAPSYEGHLSVGAGAAMAETDIANGVPRDRHFKQRFDGFYADGKGVYDKGAVFMQGSAMYSAVKGHQTSIDTNNRSDIKLSTIEAEVYSLLTSKGGLGLAAEARYSATASDEELKRNEAEPLKIIHDYETVQSFGAGVGYRHNGFNISAMAARQEKPEGYSWDERRNGFVGRFGYDGLLKGDKYSLEGRFERFDGKLTPTGIKNYSGTVELSGQWNPSPAFSVGGSYRMRFGDGAEEISGNQLLAGVRLNLPGGKHAYGNR